MPTLSDLKDYLSTLDITPEKRRDAMEIIDFADKLVNDWKPLDVAHPDKDYAQYYKPRIEELPCRR